MATPEQRDPVVDQCVVQTPDLVEQAGVDEVLVALHVANAIRQAVYGGDGPMPRRWPVIEGEK